MSKLVPNFELHSSGYFHFFMAFMSTAMSISERKRDLTGLKSLFLRIHRQICQLCFLLFFIFQCCICKKSDTCSFIMRLSVLASTVINFPEESNETRWKYTCCCSFWFILLSGTPHLGIASSCWSFATEFLIWCLN